MATAIAGRRAAHYHLLQSVQEFFIFNNNGFLTLLLKLWGDYAKNFLD
jgi:hypothetical protein